MLRLVRVLIRGIDRESLEFFFWFKKFAHAFALLYCRAAGTRFWRGAFEVGERQGARSP